MKFQQVKVRIFPDLTVQRAKRTAQFQDVRVKLCEAGIKHGIIHAATLIITFNGENKYFQDHKAAET